MFEADRLSVPALQIYAGPRAREHLCEHGLRPQDVRVIPAAAGGPKGITLLPLDQFIFGQWLTQSQQVVHLLGASIGAWRMACACLPDAAGALATLAEDYVTQTYPHAPGKMPPPDVTSSHFSAVLQQRLGQFAAQIVAHPRFRLHVFASRGRHVLHRAGRGRAALGYFNAYLANAASRQWLGACMQRVVFSDPRDALPVPLQDYPTHRAALTAANVAPAVLASCTIPFAMNPVQDVPGGPLGTYWDGGITDYHLHLNYAAMGASLGGGGGGGSVGDGIGLSQPEVDPACANLVLYPHFQPQLVPGWLDKAWKRRHGATGKLDNVVVLAPSPEWVAGLPGGKLPDRTDFARYLDDEPGRHRLWRTAYQESQRLADEFERLVRGGRPIEALPLP